MKSLVLPGLMSRVLALDMGMLGLAQALNLWGTEVLALFRTDIEQRFVDMMTKVTALVVATLLVYPEGGFPMKPCRTSYHKAKSLCAAIGNAEGHELVALRPLYWPIRVWYDG